MFADELDRIDRAMHSTRIVSLRRRSLYFEFRDSSEPHERVGISIERAKLYGATPDGPRYKAIGNSMAVPVMRWIGARIDHVDAVLRRAA